MRSSVCIILCVSAFICILHTEMSTYPAVIVIFASWSLSSCGHVADSFCLKKNAGRNTTEIGGFPWNSLQPILGLSCRIFLVSSRVVWHPPCNSNVWLAGKPCISSINWKPSTPTETSSVPRVDPTNRQQTKCPGRTIDSIPAAHFFLR